MILLCLFRWCRVMIVPWLVYTETVCKIWSSCESESVYRTNCSTTTTTTTTTTNTTTTTTTTTSPGDGMVVRVLEHPNVVVGLVLGVEQR